LNNFHAKRDLFVFACFLKRGSDIDFLSQEKY